MAIQERPSGKAGIQIQVRTDELVDTCPGHLPFAHQSTDDSSACDDIAPPCPGSSDGEFSNGEFLGASELHGLHFYILIQFQQSNIRSAVSADKPPHDRSAGSENNTDVGLVPYGVRRCQNRIAAPNDSAGRMFRPAIHCNDRLACLINNFAYLI